VLNLTARREALGLSKRETARRARVAPHVIGDVESGRTVPYVPQLRRIAAALAWPGAAYTLLAEHDPTSNRVTDAFIACRTPFLAREHGRRYAVLSVEHLERVAAHFGVPVADRGGDPYIVVETPFGTVVVGVEAVPE
jgi:DNA-binding XRE family transcriptional regulator